MWYRGLIFFFLGLLGALLVWRSWVFGGALGLFVLALLVGVVLIGGFIGSRGASTRSRLSVVMLLQFFFFMLFFPIFLRFWLVG